uniref:TIR domain-containing protein n=1 Tax=Mola mola TaxID=94237 RepID=A0A3Q3VUG1_MOLML
LAEQREHEGKETQNNVSASASASSSSTFCYSSSSSSSGITYSTTLHSQSALSSPLRWSRRFDVFVCHSSVDMDIEEAGRLVFFLEASPRSLRCFLQHRDDCPGGATSTEFCNAVKNSHLWALLITPYFLQDEWCQYMMHQALAEGPMSNRIIPLALNLSRSQYPLELKSIYSIDLSHNPVRGYTLLNNTVLHCE